MSNKSDSGINSFFLYYRWCIFDISSSKLHFRRFLSENINHCLLIFSINIQALLHSNLGSLILLLFLNITLRLLVLLFDCESQVLESCVLTRELYTYNSACLFAKNFKYFICGQIFWDVLNKNCPVVEMFFL